MLWFVDSDDPVTDIRRGLNNDPHQAQHLVQQLVGDGVVVDEGPCSLADADGLPDDNVIAGVYGRLAVICGRAVATDRPSEFTDTRLRLRPTAVAVLLHTDPVDSFGAFARWENGALRRSFAADPVDIREDEGLPYPFERGFWAGEHPLQYAEGVPHDPQALPFHPQEFAEQSTRDWLGFRFTRPLGPDDADPRDIPATRFAIRPPGWQPPPEPERQTEPVSAATEPARHPEVRPEPGQPEAPAGNRVARWFGFAPKSESHES
ncbi:hypothetical protein SAMN05445060_3137 [Williamsia sterculiae]|uniref:Uncharacterized protein n=2 Tax=Williamsia sterculiae TaxID=1344003 RepID=A0A1N7GVH9_9NOCA|nr:hypothetical protein SAMN05445060_3137 [Williamsia sterculiae]